MPARKKGAVRRGHGSMCNICGLNCGKGGALSTHVKGAHGIDYGDYLTCFYPDGATIVADSWDASVTAEDGSISVTHVLVRRLIGDPGKRGVTRTARVRGPKIKNPAAGYQRPHLSSHGSPTQVVTDADLRAGRIRIPADTMALFPGEKGKIEVLLRNKKIEVSWNPRLESSKKRSGVIGVGKEILRQLVDPGEVLEVVAGAEHLALS